MTPNVRFVRIPCLQEAFGSVSFITRMTSAFGWEAKMRNADLLKVQSYALDQLHLAARPSFRGNSQGLFYQIGCSGEPVGLHNRLLDPASIFTVSRVAQHLTEKG